MLLLSAHNGQDDIVRRHFTQITSRLSINSWLVGWLFNGTSTQKGQPICANCRGGKPALSAKDGQRYTMHITLRYTITM